MLLLLSLSFYVVHAEQAEQEADTTDTDAEEQSGAAVLFLQYRSRIQFLESELAFLQGRIEELEHSVQQLRHEHQQRYADLSGRIEDLSSDSATSPMGDRPSISPGQRIALHASDSEQGLIQNARAAMANESFEDAIAFFTLFIERYPNSGDVATARYWLGELWFQADPPNLELARQNFVQLLNLYPDYERAAEGMFRLAMIYEALGDQESSRVWATRILDSFPDSDVAKFVPQLLDDPGA